MHIPRSLPLLLLLLGCGGSDPSNRPADDGGSIPPDAGGDSGLLDAGTDDPSDASTAAVTLEACFADLSAPASGFIGVQRFRSADGKVRVVRARQTIDAPTVGETYAFALIRFWVASDEEVGSCVRGKSALSYTYAHHNWDESWSAQTDLALYEATELFNVEGTDEDRWLDALSAKGKDGAPLWGPVDLVQDGCYSLPYDLNACSSRTRSDKPPPGWGE